MVLKYIYIYIYSYQGDSSSHTAVCICFIFKLVHMKLGCLQVPQEKKKRTRRTSKESHQSSSGKASTYTLGDEKHKQPFTLLKISVLFSIKERCIRMR